ncbi:MAG: hypothetical protein AAF950_06980 [Pseudomonadota bacterium]
MRRPGSLKVVDPFADASAPDVLIRPAKKKRPAPFCLRLTAEERGQLDAAAGNLPLGTYIKDRLFDGLPAVPRQRSGTLTDRAMLSRLLGKLGASRLPQNMNQIAKAANLGTLPVTPETESEIRRACYDIAVMRLMLMKALGKSSGSVS